MTLDDERLRRWRLVLGGGDADGIGVSLQGEEAEVDGCLSALYDAQPQSGTTRPRGRPRGGLGASSPHVLRWLGDVRRLFPAPVVRVMQQDALDRLGLREMLLEPELLEAVEPDVHLVATLLMLKGVMPSRSKEAARAVVRKVVHALMRQFEPPLLEAVRGSLDRGRRNRRPRLREIDWSRTILRNLRHYQPALRTLVPEQLVGFGRRRASLRDVVLCVDQSGSMARSVVFAGVYAAVLASVPAVRTRLVVFDTSVVDLTEQLHQDPVDLLFGVQLGGGTDIERALGYCQRLVERPEDTVLVLLSDLFEGGSPRKLRDRLQRLVHAGVQCIVLLALDDEGTPWHDHDVAAFCASLGIPCFGCTPSLFPALMALALAKGDVARWASAHGIALARAAEADLLPASTADASEGDSV